MIITQLFGPEEVTVYGIAFKYMSSVTMIFAIVMTPFWSAFTDAYHSSDIAWIVRIMKKLMMLWVGCVVFAGVLIVLAAPFYSLWVGSAMHIPFALTLSMAVYVCVNAWNSIFASFQNGVGVLRLQLIGAIGGGILTVPLAIFLASTLGIGVKGVLWATIAGSLLPAVWSPIQYRKIIAGTATGIWAK
jgi:O-antigen/teichoic acid export membrane protein